ncbi:MAG: GntR family transcriptional regulator [Pseudorhodoplanes sp.]|uniref:GntR family transcriptional regulator n=1 Tax=Pseudorhodoplanes sp. TaxID=1934341 RepID=UPI003D0EB8CC
MRNRSSERSDPQRISMELRGQILQGVFPLGARMPTEDEMCRQFGASRYSVREAMRVLTEEGLVARRPRIGTIVAATKPSEHFVQSVPSMQKLLNYPEGTVRKTIGTGYVEANAELAALLKCPVGERRFRIRALRYAVGSSVPLCYTDIYILPQYATIVNHPHHEFTLVSDQIREVFGERAEKTVIEISSSSIKRNIAKLLDVKPATPSLTVTRRYANARGEEFETTVAVHPASRYTYSFEFKRQP